jgi:hypothetical protein
MEFRTRIGRESKFGANGGRHRTWCSNSLHPGCFAIGVSFTGVALLAGQQENQAAVACQVDKPGPKNVVACKEQRGEHAPTIESSRQGCQQQTECASSRPPLPTPCQTCGQVQPTAYKPQEATPGSQTPAGLPGSPAGLPEPFPGPGSRCPAHDRLVPAGEGDQAPLPRRAAR